VSAALDTLNTARAVVGAAQNRLEFASDNLATSIENTEAARSSLLDLDVAKEMTMFTSKQILVQSGVSMLAQANQMPQSLLKLFQ
jgi:flagellin